jgi:peptidoglycan/xylan/chitin deacetylase (PgdA/CDA1 family)
LQTVPALVSTATATLPAGSPPPFPADPVGTPDDFPSRYQPRTVTAPILLYHHISADTPPVRYTIAVRRFEAQLDYLVACGSETITMQDLVSAVRFGTPLPSRPVMLTFDDGNQDLFDLAYPRMQARGMIGVAYVVGNRIGAEGFLNAESLRALRRAGWEIGSHGMTHVALTDLASNALTVEIARSKSRIEDALDETIHSFAYPFGIVTEESLLAIVDAGYTSGAGLGLSNVHRPDGLLYLERREVRGTYELQDFFALLGSP